MNIYCQFCDASKEVESGLCPQCARFGVPIICPGCGARFIPQGAEKHCTVECNAYAMKEKRNIADQGRSFLP